MPIGVRNKGNKPRKGTYAPTTTSTKSGSSTGSSGSASAAGGSGGDGGYASYLKQQKAAQAKAERRETKQAKNTVKRLSTQNKGLRKQAKALQLSLSASGFANALQINLNNVDRTLGQQKAVLLDGFESRLSQLRGSAADNEKEFADQSTANLANRNRERLASVTEALNQGAGESDILATQAMALRNWSQNQSGFNRSFHDTVRSVNASITDLNADTQTAMSNMELDAASNREKLWNQFYEQNSETQAQLGNVYGQMAVNATDKHGVLSDRDTGAFSKKAAKRAREAAKRYNRRSGRAFTSAAQLTGMAYSNPGVSQETQNWSGAPLISGTTNNSVMRINEAAEADQAMKRPEGATLRKWRDG